MANSDIRSTGSGWTYFSKTRFTSVIFQTQKQYPHYVFTKPGLHVKACEARALPIDLSGKRVEPAPVHRFDYHGGWCEQF